MIVLVTEKIIIMIRKILTRGFSPKPPQGGWGVKYPEALILISYNRSLPIAFATFFRSVMRRENSSGLSD